MRISIINEAAPIPDRLNEDTCYVSSDGSEVQVLVADGAGQRFKTSKTANMLTWQGTPVSAARFAALTTLNAARDYSSPKEILLQANERIAWNLELVYGELTAAALRTHEPQLAPYLDQNPRLLRLALPVCVATVARIDKENQQLEYAHVGDTTLFLFYRDGRIHVPTADQMGKYDAQALALAVSIKAEQGAAHLMDILNDPRIAENNRNNGLYHNYVDEQGQTDVNVGVGVINGLPEVESYIQMGTVDLHDVTGVMLCSDGFLWPAPLTENETEQSRRYQHMRDIIEQEGLHGYYEKLRAAEAADATRDQYPRFKIHDDATGVYLEV